jgi:hypothetical protein
VKVLLIYFIALIQAFFLNFQIFYFFLYLSFPLKKRKAFFKALEATWEATWEAEIRRITV